MQLLVQHTAALADPAALAGRHTHHQSVVRHIFGDHCTRTNHRPSADGVSADDGRVGSDGGSHADQRFFITCRALGIFCPRGQIIGEHHRRSAENIVLQLDPFIDGNVVLHLDAVADADVACNIDILPKGAVFPDDRSALQMAKIPYFCILSDGHTGVDVAALMHKKIRHSVRSFPWSEKRGKLPLFSLISLT